LLSLGIAVLLFFGGLTIPLITARSERGKPRPYNSCT